MSALPELPELPEGECCAWLQNGTRINAFNRPAQPFTSRDAPYWESKGYSRVPLFTVEQMSDYSDARAAHARKQALEEAAKVCDGAAKKSRNSLFRSGANICAGLIKELLK